MGKQKTPRRSYSPELKATILRRHLTDKVAISDLCDEYKLQPSVIYGWLQQAIANLELALQPSSRKARGTSRETKLSREVEALTAKLATKDNVIAEVSEEMVSLKKQLGGL